MMTTKKSQELKAFDEIALFNSVVYGTVTAVVTKALRPICSESTVLVFTDELDWPLLIPADAEVELDTEPDPEEESRGAGTGSVLETNWSPRMRDEAGHVAREDKPAKEDCANPAFRKGYNAGYAAARHERWDEGFAERLAARRNTPPPVPWHTRTTEPAKSGMVRTLVPCCSRVIHLDPGVEGPLEGDHLAVCRVCLTSYRVRLTQEEPSGYEEEGDDRVWHGAGFQPLGRVVLAGTRRR